MTHQKANTHDFETALRENGFVSLGRLLTQAECEEVRRLYDSPDNFRSRINTAQHRFGKGNINTLDILYRL